MALNLVVLGITGAEALPRKASTFEGCQIATPTLESQWIRCIQRIIPRERIGLAGLGHVGIDAQELVGRGVVIAPY
jgi:hypothetical protein